MGIKGEEKFQCYYYTTFGALLQDKKCFLFSENFCLWITVCKRKTRPLLCPRCVLIFSSGYYRFEKSHARKVDENKLKHLLNQESKEDTSFSSNIQRTIS
jgi:hypothetical protein